MIPPTLSARSHRQPEPALEVARRRRWRYSLRGLLALTTIVAGLLGWHQWYRHWYVRQAAAIQELADKGLARQWSCFNRSDGWRGWLMPAGLAKNDHTFELLSGDNQVFDLLGRISVRGVYVNTRDFDDGDLDRLVDAAPALQNLVLRQSSVTDGGLAELRRLKSLSRLSLGDICISARDLSGNGARWYEFPANQLTDGALTVVRDLGQLRQLRVVSDSVGRKELAPFAQSNQLELLLVVSPELTDGCLANIVPHAHLKGLFLGGGKFSAAGLKQLVSLTELQSLAFKNSRLDAACLAEIGRISSLETLSLEDTGVRGADLESLATLPKLWNLFLAGSEFDNKLLNHLQGCPSLAHLHLHETGVNDEGVDALLQLKHLNEIFITPNQLSAAVTKRLPKKLTIFDNAQKGDPPILFFGVALNRFDMQSDVPPLWKTN